MPASKKEGGKNRKIGRHSRNPSSKLQPLRTARNKAKRADLFKLESAQPHAYPKPRPLTREEIRAAERVVYSGLVGINHATHVLVVNGVTIETGTHYQCSAAQHSLSPDHKGGIFPIARYA